MAPGGPPKGGRRLDRSTVAPAVRIPHAEMVTTTAITVRDLRKRYPARSGSPAASALDGVEFDVHTGEVVALLGPNGAGKTTTVEILEGYRRRDEGHVEVLGHDPATAPREFLTRIGIVGQSQVGAMDELTVDEVVDHFAHYYPHNREPDEVVALVGLQDKRRSRVRSLSGGQRRRLDVALGVVGRPELLFLDEPTTGFDPEARRQFWDLVRQLAADGTTVLLTTHYLEEAEALADRVAVLARGRVVAAGCPATLGGRDRAPSVISWDGPDGRLFETTDQPTALVHRLFRDFAGEVPGLAVTRPSLEDVYLQLIGEAG